MKVLFMLLTSPLHRHEWLMLAGPAKTRTTELERLRSTNRANAATAATPASLQTRRGDRHQSGSSATALREVPVEICRSAFNTKIQPSGDT
jgi:hypothetical protein